MEFKYIFFRKLPFCRFMHSLRKNENISMWGKRIAPQQNKLLPFLPGSVLKYAVIILVFWLHYAREAHFSYISLPFLHNYDVKISRLVENVNKQQRNFISLPELGYGPFKFNVTRIRLHLTK